MAAERGGRPGDEIGYQVRFDRCTGPQTRIQVVTEGIFLRMLQDDPFLESVAVVVFDEFHERSIQSDLALAMVQRVRETARPDLKVVVMSATLDLGPIARYLRDCPVVESQGRLYPVAISYARNAENRPIADRAAEGVLRILDLTVGDVLVFLPGVSEIRQTSRRLESLGSQGMAVLPLYGDLPAEKQDQALSPMGRRKVVLATNVAETSITIEGITGVVDMGLARSLVFDPHVGMDRLQLVRISQASADQRAGRAGRTGPGICLRMWPERTHRDRPAQDEPEIRRLDLAGPVIQLRTWGEKDLRTFPWFEAPAEAALEQAEATLRRLDALDAAGNVTELGKAMARLPIHPRLGRVLLEGLRLGRPEEAALAAALLSERDPFARVESVVSDRRPVSPPSNSDILDRMAALEAFEQSGNVSTPLGLVKPAAARFVLHARDQLLREVRRAGGWSPGFSRSDKEQPSEGETPTTADEAVRRALLAAFPDRLARRTSSGSRFGRMVGGRGVRLAATSAVRGAPLFLAVDVRSRQLGGPRLAGIGDRAGMAPRRAPLAPHRRGIRSGSRPGRCAQTELLGRPIAGRDAGGASRQRRSRPDPRCRRR